jgi:hypothetical protein
VKAAVSITDDGKTITTTRTNNAWGGSGTFSTESIDGDGYVSFKLVSGNTNIQPTWPPWLKINDSLHIK